MNKLILYLLLIIIFSINPLQQNKALANDKWTFGDLIKDLEKLVKSKQEGVGFSWLKIPPGARGTALANAYLSTAEGPGAIWWNPAGIIHKNNDSQGWNACFTHIQNFIGRYEFLGASNRSGKNAYGIALSQMAIQGLEHYDEQQIYYGNFDAHGLLVSFSYAREIEKELKVGTTIKGLYERIYIYNVCAWLLDFGLNYSLTKDIHLGITGVNIGPSPKYEIQPITPPRGWKLGISYEKKTFIASINTYKYIDALLRSAIGIEYNPISYLSLRAGYVMGSDTENFSSGFGINWKGIKLDYAFKPYHNIGSSHVITLTR